MNWWLLGPELMILVAAVLSLWRLIRGPDLADRVAALDLMTILLVGFLAIRMLVTDETILLDVALTLGLVGFLSTVGLGLFIRRRGEDT